jgi:hypothetical protein
MIWLNHSQWFYKSPRIFHAPWHDAIEHNWECTDFDSHLVKKQRYRYGCLTTKSDLISQLVVVPNLVKDYMLKDIVFLSFFVYCFTSRSRIFHLHGNITIAGEGCKVQACARRSGTLSWEGSLPCHTYCGPQFCRSHPMDRPILSPRTCMTRKGVWRIYSNPDPHRS